MQAVELPSLSLLHTLSLYESLPISEWISKPAHGSNQHKSCCCCFCNLSDRMPSTIAEKEKVSTYTLSLLLLTLIPKCTISNKACRCKWLVSLDSLVRRNFPGDTYLWLFSASTPMLNGAGVSYLHSKRIITALVNKHSLSLLVQLNFCKTVE
jgi:hypothetical protein